MLATPLDGVLNFNGLNATEVILNAPKNLKNRVGGLGVEMVVGGGPQSLKSEIQGLLSCSE